MRTIHLNTIIPDKLYQRGQFVTFPWAAKMSMLEQYNIGMVVNLWARPDPELHAKQGLIYIHWPIAGNEPPLLANSMIDLINAYIYAQVSVLVHCEAGVNRSIWLAAKLLARHENICGEEALNKMTANVGRTKMRSGLRTDLINTK